MSEQDGTTRALHEHTATELAALIARREVSSREVVQAHLDRIDEVNGQVNAITVLLGDAALDAADDADASPGEGPLHGVPFTVKESIDCLGSPTTYGLPAMARVLPGRDAPAVERLRAAGAIPIGRTNMSEFGMRLSTDNPLRGRTLNPWNPGVTVGGSSGGDGAALATGMTPLGLGTDMGGSVRSPAYCCGIAALKPTTGRVPHASSIEPLDGGMSQQALTVAGPMARSIEDLRLTLSVLAGRDVRDPRSVDVPLRGPPPRHKRVALVTELPGIDLPEVTRVAVLRAGEALADAGWTLEQTQPPALEAVTEVWGHVVSVDMSTLLPSIKPMLSLPLFDHMERLCAMFDPGELSNRELHARRAGLTRQWSLFFAAHPILVGPTWGQLPWPPDADLEGEAGERLLLDTSPMLLPANVLGLPCVALPTGVVDDAPTGVQVCADLWREDLCLDAATIIEAACGATRPIDPAS